MASDASRDHPEQIGPYRILQVLGEGGMGIVYEAEQLEPVRRRVALKVIKLGMDSKDVVARFEAERQALAVMSHPGIAQVLDGGMTEQARPFFVMELVKGIPFTEYCDNRQLPLRERIALFTKVVHAVQHAHQKGVIHRDIKPSNVLVTEHEGEATIKIIDFGIAKAIAQPLTEKTLVTAYGMALGTLAYMSPEQAELSNLDIDTRSDIYSLGVMLFEVLVGELPVDPSQMGAVPFLAQLVGRTSDPERPSARMTTTARARRQAQLRRAASGQLRKLLRGDLDWIVVKAMEKDRNRRYDTANALAQDLERHLRNEPVLARPPSTWYRFRKFARRNRAAVAAGAGITVALVAGVIATSVGLLRATRAEAEAQRESETAQQVSEFLVDLFRQGDPGRAGGRQLTVKEVLDSGAVRIRRELADRPLVRARLMKTIGEAYYMLRELDAAIPLVEQALVIQDSAGIDPPERVHTRILLSSAYIQYGDFGQAEQLGREALAILGEHPDPDDEHLLVGATTMLVFGALRSGATPPDAEQMLTRLIERRDPDAPDDHEMGNIQDILCWVHLDKGNLEAGEHSCSRTVAIRRMRGADDPMGLLVGLGRLANLRHNQGRLDEAIALQRESLDIGRATYGDTHFEIAYNHHALSRIYRQLGQLDSALANAREALRIRRAVLTPDNSELATSLFELATVHRQRGELRQGLAAWEEGLAVSERSLHGRRGNPAASLLALMRQHAMHAALLRAAGQAAEARAEDARVVALLDSARASGALGDSVSALTLNGACWITALAGHGARALETCDEAVDRSDEGNRPRIRDSRGVARAQAGDLTGAIADFEAYMANPANVSGIPVREEWIASLRAGRSPFTRAALDELLIP